MIKWSHGLLKEICGFGIIIEVKVSIYSSAGLRKAVCRYQAEYQKGNGIRET